MKVLILFGGESSEHEVSIVSAGNIYNSIDKTKHEVILGFICPRGRLFMVGEARDHDNVDELTEIMPVMGQGRFVLANGDKIEPDVIFPALHGENGEDGAIPALAKLLHIPIVGCDMHASALCMDKLATKEVLEYIGVKTAPFRVHDRDNQINFNEAKTALGTPLFVKPTKTGSSVGISKVSSEPEFKAALKLAHKYGDTVLIESAIPGAREIEVAMFGNNQPEASIAGEIVPDREFYDYDSKYSDDSTSRAVIPADLPDDIAKQIHDMAIKAYKVLGCSGLSRIDFLYGDDGQVILNEINTLPGFTDISMYPKLWEHMGLNQTELIDKLLELAK